MEFGIGIDTHVNKRELVRYAEELGYDSAWVPDSQMIWSDCYATMALAAVNTRRIRIGTGVAIAGTRIAPVTAHSIASINQLAPGRIFLGIGTGHTAMRVMGQDPMPPREFREYLRVVRALLDGKEADYTYAGKTRQIKFLHRDRHFVNLDNRIPIYVAANGPKALRATGAHGDGWMTVTSDPEEFRHSMEGVRAGAQEVGRALGPDFHTACVTTACVLRPGEKLTDERVINETGPARRWHAYCISRGKSGGSSARRTNWSRRSSPMSGMTTCGGWTTTVCPRPRAFGRSTTATALSCSPRSGASSLPRRLLPSAWSARPRRSSISCMRWRRPGSRKSRCSRPPIISARYFAVLRR